MQKCRPQQFLFPPRDRQVQQPTHLQKPIRLPFLWNEASWRKSSPQLRRPNRALQNKAQVLIVSHDPVHSSQTQGKSTKPLLSSFRSQIRSASHPALPYESPVRLIATQAVKAFGWFRRVFSVPALPVKRDPLPVRRLPIN